ncbi:MULTISPECIES: transcriptional regulator domain-containing protein [Pseudomonadota]|nr:hypothetical protein [Methylobacterium sp.]
MPQESDWRSSDAYDYIDQLHTSDLAWEFLRRNRQYRESYYELARGGQVSGEQARRFAEQWGLSFRFGPGAYCPPPTGLLDPDHRPRRRSARTAACAFGRPGCR